MGREREYNCVKKIRFVFLLLVWLFLYASTWIYECTLVEVLLDGAMSIQPTTTTTTALLGLMNVVLCMRGSTI
jgi:hypothetical protein